jgi:hypothetical protein
MSLRSLEAWPKILPGSRVVALEVEIFEASQWRRRAPAPMVHQCCAVGGQSSDFIILCIYIYHMYIYISYIIYIWYICMQYIYIIYIYHMYTYIYFSYWTRKPGTIQFENHLSGYWCPVLQLDLASIEELHQNLNKSCCFFLQDWCRFINQ